MLWVVQSVVPHAHSAELAAVPSVLEQVANWLHEDFDASQNSPVAVLQLVVPQAQVAELAAEPSVLEQVSARHRPLLEESQISPVSAVQTLVLQTHGPTSLTVTPSSWAQAGAVKAHRQASELP